MKFSYDWFLGPAGLENGPNYPAAHPITVHFSHRAAPIQA